jgi:hypothetical protein
MTQKRQRRTAADRMEPIERWEQSGVSAREFAAQVKLRSSSLYRNRSGPGVFRFETDRQADPIVI